MKKIVFAALIGILVIPVVAAAQVDHTGKWALGYWDPEAPIGIRYQVSQKVGVDFGFAFATEKVSDLATAALGDEKTKIQFNFEAGVPITLVAKDRVNFFFRPGVLVKMIPYYYATSTTAAYESKTATDFGVSGILGVEWFVTDDFSLSVGHGLQMLSTKDVEIGDAEDTVEPESCTTFRGAPFDITKIGFRFYF